jgi:hypothetical protein
MYLVWPTLYIKCNAWILGLPFKKEHDKTSPSPNNHLKNSLLTEEYEVVTCFH